MQLSTDFSLSKLIITFPGIGIHSKAEYLNGKALIAAVISADKGD